MRPIFPSLCRCFSAQSNSLQEGEEAERQEGTRWQESTQDHHEPRAHGLRRQLQMPEPNRLPAQSSNAPQRAPLHHTEGVDWSSHFMTYPNHPHIKSTETREAFKGVAPTNVAPLTKEAIAEAKIIAVVERLQRQIDGDLSPMPAGSRLVDYDMPYMRAGLEKALNWARSTNPEIEDRLKEADWEALTQIMQLALLDEVQRNIDTKAFVPRSNLEPFTDFHTTFAVQVVVALCLLLEAQGMPSTVVQMRAQVLHQDDPEAAVPPLDSRLSKCLLLLSLRVHDRHRHANNSLQEFHNMLMVSKQTSG